MLRTLTNYFITAGCTTQACSFRDNYDEFIEAGFDVYCLSADTPAAQKRWKDKVCLCKVSVLFSSRLHNNSQKNLQYTILSDPSREFIAFLGAGSAKTQRSHFVFALKDGKAIMIDKKAKISPKDRCVAFLIRLDDVLTVFSSVSKALEVVKAF